MKRGRKEIATKEKRRIKRAIAEKDDKNSDDSTQSINRAQHDNAPLFQSLTCTTSRYHSQTLFVSPSHVRAVDRKAGGARTRYALGAEHLVDAAQVRR